MKCREGTGARPRYQSAEGPRQRSIKIRVTSRAFPPDFFVKGTQKALAPILHRRDQNF
jgi:hypothetical protein